MHDKPVGTQVSTQGHGETPSLLIDPHHARHDLNLLGRAIRRRWPIRPEHQEILVNRLIKILEKDSVSVMTRDGLAQLDGPADKNAVAAAKVFVAMVAQDQAADLAELKKMEPKEPTTNIGIMGSLWHGQDPSRWKMQSGRPERSSSKCSNARSLRLRQADPSGEQTMTVI